MAYIGKFKDTTPIICPAGVVEKPTHGAKECLQWYSLEDKIDSLKHDVGIYEEHKEPFKYKLPELENFRNCGIFTPIRNIIRPTPKTDFQTLVNDLKETYYDSYWNKVVGRTKDPIPGMPAGFDIKGTTYGRPPEKGATVKELINPSKTHGQVLDESQVGHKLYRVSHNDYNLGEMKDRNYLKPSYNPKKMFGEKSTYDPRGMGMRCCMKWVNSEPITDASAIQADEIERTEYRMAKCLTPNENIKSVPEGHRFGRPCDRDLYGVEELLKRSPPSLLKRDYQDWIGHLTGLRWKLKKRNPEFKFLEFFNNLKYFDKEKRGWVPAEIVYELCKCYEVNPDVAKLEPLMLLGGMLQNGMVDYEGFVDMLRWKSDYPEFKKINDIPPEYLSYETSYYAATVKDRTQINNADKPCAGLSSYRTDFPGPKLAPRTCLADLESLGDETSGRGVVNPSIYTSYGVSHYDLLKPRPMEELREIFENIGVKFTDDEFCKLWEKGYETDKTGLVCVETFKRLIKEKGNEAVDICDTFQYKRL